MRKYIISVCLLLAFWFIAEAQTNDGMAWEKVNSTLKELKTAKGEKLVDCYNLLAQCYVWIWDEDVYLDTACMYANKAYAEAKKINYTKGIGYAKASLFYCQKPEVDKNRDNNDTEKAYTQRIKLGQEVITIAEQLKDDYLAGLIYYQLASLENGSGSKEKYKDNVLKGISHFEKVKREYFENNFKPLFFIDCAGCTGTEAVLGSLNRDLTGIYFPENNTLANEKAELAIQYFNKVRTIKRRGFLNYPVGALYQRIGQLYFYKFDYKNALESYKKAKETYHEDIGPGSPSIELELGQHNEMSKTYEAMSDFENGIQNFRNSVKLIEDNIKDKPAGSARSNTTGQTFFWMSRIYKIAGDYEGALAVMRRGYQYYPKDSFSIAPWYSETGDAHRLLGNYDSAMYYLKAFQNTDNFPNNFGKVSLGYLYLDMKEYVKAQSLTLPFYQYLKTLNRSTNPIVNALNILGNSSLGERKYEQALQYAKEAQGHLRLMNTKVLMIDNYKLLSDIHEKMNHPDSALTYFKLYSKLKDSLINKQFLFKLSNLKNESEEQKKTSLIQLLQKDNVIKEQLLQEKLLRQKQNEAGLALLNQSNKIKDQELLIKEQNLKEQTLLKEQNLSQVGLLDKENKLKDQRLKQQAIFRNALLAGLLLFLALGIFIFRSLSLKRKNERLQNEKRQAEFQQKASELEMQALRAQMNPHFIFNCLSSINKFILKNDTDTASDYLTRFSRLIRQSLTNSQLSLIPLSDEIEMLRLYLDMERLRFSESFNYNIVYENTIEPETIYIPPMLLQPFCENAIWHGLQHLPAGRHGKEGYGKLEIIMSLQNGELQCIIADNGIGREKAAELKNRLNGKQKSFGLKITTERLALFNNEKTVHSFYKTDDVLDANGKIAGTKVVLNIKFKNSVQQPVKETI
jgi:hypothetical protein